MKYLGVDWGLRKIGLAVSEGQLASPLSVLMVKNLKEAGEKIAEIAKQEGIELVVLGKPGGEMGKRVERAARRLKALGLKVQTADETLSTQRAKLEMVKLGFSQKARREDNALSAAVILQDFLDNQ